MLVLSPSWFSATADDGILSHDQGIRYWMVSNNTADHSYFNIDHDNENTENFISASYGHDPYFQFPNYSSGPNPPHHVPPPPPAAISNDDNQPRLMGMLRGGERPLRVKKQIRHNAHERDRRKKLNNLYSSLRSMLPGLHTKKKLSIPDTVSYVLNYIPELRNQIESLKIKKGEMLSKISGQILQGDVVSSLRRNKRSGSTSTSLLLPSPANISVKEVGDREVAIQICSSSCCVDKDGERRPSNHSLSAIVERLEGHGFCLLNSASFSIVEGRVYHNLHLQGDHMLLPFTWEISCFYYGEEDQIHVLGTCLPFLPLEWARKCCIDPCKGRRCWGRSSYVSARISWTYEYIRPGPLAMIMKWISP